MIIINTPSYATFWDRKKILFRKETRSFPNTIVEIFHLFLYKLKANNSVISLYVYDQGDLNLSRHDIF